MNLFKLPKTQAYLYSAICGIILILIGTYSFLEALKTNENFEIFLRGLFLFLWIIFAINYTVRYIKRKKSTWK